ncbi:MAG TPA: multiheme c-type cytochrome [Pseudomonadales bacterium]|nr:multiheme c-type cytochrome [Pseudomonadales bacterium]
MTRKRKPRSVPAPALAAGTRPAISATTAHRRWWPGLLAALAALGIAAWLLSPRDAPPAAPAPATEAAATGAPTPPSRPAGASAAPPEVAGFVGSEACGECHRAEHAAWQGSQHARAMQHATPATVLVISMTPASTSRASSRASSGATAASSCVPTDPTASSPTSR